MFLSVKVDRGQQCCSQFSTRSSPFLNSLHQTNPRVLDSGGLQMKQVTILKIPVNRVVYFQKISVASTPWIPNNFSQTFWKLKALYQSCQVPEPKISFIFDLLPCNRWITIATFFYCFCCTAVSFQHINLCVIANLRNKLLVK